MMRTPGPEPSSTDPGLSSAPACSGALVFPDLGKLLFLVGGGVMRGPKKDIHAVRHRACTCELYPSTPSVPLMHSRAFGESSTIPGLQAKALRNGLRFLWGRGGGGGALIG